MKRDDGKEKRKTQHHFNFIVFAVRLVYVIAVDVEILGIFSLIY